MSQSRCQIKTFSNDHETNLLHFVEWLNTVLHVWIFLTENEEITVECQPTSSTLPVPNIFKAKTFSAGIVCYFWWRNKRIFEHEECSFNQVVEQTEEGVVGLV
jgi:hypothetical protein